MDTESSRSVAWSRIGDVSTRLGYVVYAIFWLSSVGAIAISFLDENTSISRAIFFSSLAALGLLLFLEMVRRVLMYVIAGNRLFSRKFPLIAKILLGLAIFGAVIAIPIYIFYDIPREREEKAIATIAYQKALVDLPDAQMEEDKCIANSKSGYRSVECRRVTLGYESCIENLSRAFCLSSWDYETACESSKIIPYSYGCFSRTSDLREIIREYEEKYHIKH